MIYNARVLRRWSALGDWDTGTSILMNLSAPRSIQTYVINAGSRRFCLALVLLGRLINFVLFFPLQFADVCLVATRTFKTRCSFGLLGDQRSAH
jgi:hypothetical protein